MRGINKFMIMGYLGADPVSRTIQNGNGLVVNFSVATSDVWNDKQSGEKREATEWHRISCFNRLAEIVMQYAKKGSAVFVEGSIHHKKVNENGVDKYYTELRANSIQLISTGQSNNNYQGGQGQGGQNWNNNQGGQGGQNWNNNQGGQGGQNWNNNQGGGYYQGNNHTNNGGFGNQGGGFNNQGGGFSNQSGGFNNQGGGFDNQAPNSMPGNSSNTGFTQTANTVATQPNNSQIATPTPGVIDDDIPFRGISNQLACIM